jgi:hypothetical protein
MAQTNGVVTVRTASVARDIGSQWKLYRKTYRSPEGQAQMPQDEEVREEERAIFSFLVEKRITAMP